MVGWRVGSGGGYGSALAALYLPRAIPARSLRDPCVIPVHSRRILSLIFAADRHTKFSSAVLCSAHRSLQFVCRRCGVGSSFDASFVTECPQVSVQWCRSLAILHCAMPRASKRIPCSATQYHHSTSTSLGPARGGVVGGGKCWAWAALERHPFARWSVVHLVCGAARYSWGSECVGRRRGVGECVDADLCAAAYV